MAAPERKVSLLEAGASRVERIVQDLVQAYLKDATAGSRKTAQRLQVVEQGC